MNITEIKRACVLGAEFAAKRSFAVCIYGEHLNFELLANCHQLAIINWPLDQWPIVQNWPVARRQPRGVTGSPGGLEPNLKSLGGGSESHWYAQPVTQKLQVNSESVKRARPSRPARARLGKLDLKQPEARSNLAEPARGARLETCSCSDPSHDRLWTC